MKYLTAIQSAIPVAWFATLSALAQSPSPAATSSLNLDPPAARSLNRLGLSYGMGFNAPVSFRNLGGFAALSLARYTPDGDRYNYDNGYVLRDSSATGEYTRYWGYDNASQVSADGTITMQRSYSAATASSNDHYDTPMSGIELTYNREFIHKKAWRGGLGGAFGYTHMSVHDSGMQSANVTRATDTYSFAAGPGTVVPPAPYTGRFVGQPGDPVLISSAEHTITQVERGASITGQREFSADLFAVKVGPYLEIPLSKSIAFTLSGGFAAVYVNSDFHYNETVTVFGVGSLGHHGAGSGNQWLTGGYVAGSLSVALSDSWALAAGAEFIDVGRYIQTVNGKEATLDLSKSIFVTLGHTYSF